MNMLPWGESTEVGSKSINCLCVITLAISPKVTHIYCPPYPCPSCCSWQWQLWLDSRHDVHALSVFVQFFLLFLFFFSFWICNATPRWHFVVPLCRKEIKNLHQHFLLTEKLHVCSIRILQPKPIARPKPQYWTILQKLRLSLQDFMPSVNVTRLSLYNICIGLISREIMWILLEPCLGNMAFCNHQSSTAWSQCRNKRILSTLISNSTSQQPLTGATYTMCQIF